MIKIKKHKSIAVIMLLVFFISQVFSFNGAIIVYAEEDIPNTIVNPGFETGDMTGWTILEGEAFSQDSASGDQTWWVEAIPYNQEGKYHLNGWKCEEAATGRVRSTTFRLGGSGWITFKLGGGRNVNLVHIKIRDAETDEVLAIYGNTAFADVNFPNIELGMRLANMEQYRADLSEYIGRKLYIEIVDNATNDWGLIFADAFFTYHETVPTEGLLARNFLIKNPGFETGDIRGWTVVEGGAFGPDSVSGDITWWAEAIPYNQEGQYHLNGWKYPESEKGKIRSSTFMLAGSGWITFKLGGGGDPNKVYIEVYDADKNELVAVYANTEFADKNFPNIDEGMRLANMVQYRADLSDFIGKDLYIQIVDEATEGWGLIFADAFFTYHETIPAEGVIAQNRYIPPTTVSKYGIQNPDFETGDFEGWEIEGDAFLVSNEKIDSIHPKNAYYAVSQKEKIGSIKSTKFTIGNAARIEFMIGGNRDTENLYVALLDADTDEVLIKETPSSSDFETVTWELKPYLGEKVYIQVVDQTNTGFIMVDGFEVNKGLIAYWSFDEMQGKYAKDKAADAEDYINYTFNNAKYKPSTDPQWRNNGVNNGALLFDGYSTWIEREASRFGEISDELTIEAWIAPRSYEWGDGGKLSAIVNQYSKGKREGFILGMYRHGTWSFQVGIGNKWIEVWSEDQVLAKNQWSHVAATFSKDTSTAKLYLNGELVAEAQTPAQRSINISAANLMIGKNNEAVKLNGVFDYNMFNGLIDELKIYNKAFTDEEIQTHYAQDLAPYNGNIPQIKYEDIALDPKVYDGDRYRPQYHAIPPGHWMNEPHAPIYYKGKYHLFYQHNPQGPFFHQIHWGHWVSDDLVHWEYMPVALSPQKGDIAPDGMWAGSATYDANGKPVLLFTAGNDSKAPNQAVGLATPKDINDPYLKEWEVYPRLINEQKPGMGKFGEFRDNFTWKDGEKWYQIVTSGSTITKSGTALIYVSDDLYNWEYKGELYQADLDKYPYLGTVWELPVLLPVKDQKGNQKYILTVLPAGEKSDVEVFYWIGEFDKENCRFIPDHEEPKLMDLGDSKFTGGAGMVDPKTGRTIFFTIAQLINGTAGNQFYYDLGWAHNAGLPISLSLGDDGELRLEPIEELKSLRGKQLVSLSNKSLEEANQLIQDIQGDTLEIELEIEPEDAKKFGIKVRRTPNGEEETLLYYNKEDQTFSVDRTKTTSDPDLKMSSGIQGGKVDLKGENLQLHIYLDRSMVEAYINHRKSLTTRVFPSKGDAMGLKLWADGNITVKSMNVWEMKSAYGDGSIVPGYWTEFTNSTPENVGHLVNHDFATGDLTGWIVAEGNAFTDAHVTDVDTYWGGKFNPTGEIPGKYHYWGFNEALGGDSLTGVMKSQNFILGGDGQIDFLIGGGNDIDRLYVALVRASDEQELFKATGRNIEEYSRVLWNASEYIGEELYIKVVDNHTGGFGHLNLDDVNVPVKLEPLMIDGIPSKLKIGQQAQTVVSVVYDKNYSKDVTFECTFKISNPTIAEVDSHGLITAKKRGATVVEAVYESLQGRHKGVFSFTVVDSGSSSGDNNSKPPSGATNQPVNEPLSTVLSNTKGVELLIEGKTSKTAEGRIVFTVTADEDMMEKALAALKNTDGKVLKINVKNVSDLAEVIIPIKSILKVQKEVPNVVIEIETNHGNYKLPIRLIDFSFISDDLGVSVEQGKLKISIGSADDEQVKAVMRIAQESGLNVLSDIIDFGITIEAEGKSKGFNDFGNTYVERSIYVDKVSDNRYSTAVMYNPQTHELSFVPSIFDVKEGKAIVTIKRNRNCIYAVVENNKSFEDVTSHWAKEDIELLTSKLVVKGVDSKRFNPNGKVTRAEFAAMLVRALGLSTDQAQAVFKDVDENSWYGGIVQKAVQAKIINGYEDGTFRPHENITRQEMAVMIIRAFEFTGTTVDVHENEENLLSEFTDGDGIQPWAKEAIAKAVRASIVSGRSESEFVPNGTATRAEAAKMIKNLLKYVDFIN